MLAVRGPAALLARRSFSAQMRISASPAKCLFDETIRITASGIPPNERVRIVNWTDVPGIGPFESSAEFTADSGGKVDLARDAPVGESAYSGVQPMGIFVSLRPSAELRPGTRAMPRTAARPWRHTLRLSCQRTGEEAEASVERAFLHPAVQRTEVEDGPLRGALFHHRDGVARPGILDLFGTGGGLMEHRAALLAAKGFTVLALPYFGYRDLPKAMGEDEPIHMDYFLRAIQWLRQRPEVLGPRIGVVGTSLGGFLAFLLTELSGDIRAAVSINGAHRLPSGWVHLTIPGRTLAKAKGDLGNVEWTEQGIRLRGHQEKQVGGDHVAIAASPEGTKFLCVASGDDQSEASEMSLQVWREQMRSAGRLGDWSELVYPKAGHLLEPPHQPFCPSSYHRVSSTMKPCAVMNLVLLKAAGGQLLWGGELEGHSEAQEDLWPRLQAFLADHLGKPTPPSQQAKL